MFESYASTPRGTGRGLRSRIFGIAVLLHVAVVGGAFARDYLRVPPIDAPPPLVELRRIETPPSPPDAVEPESVEMDPPSEPAEIRHEVPVAADVLVEPDRMATTIDLSTQPVLELPPPGTPVRTTETGRGVEGGVTGGIPRAGARPSTAPTRSPDVRARLVHRVLPEYPSRARRARVEGTVRLEAIILVDGTVSDIEVIEGLRMGCTEAAIAAVRDWRYEPARSDGRTVASILEVDVTFALQD